MRFDLVRARATAFPRELPAAPAILTPVRLDSTETWVPHDTRARGRPAAVLVLLFPDHEGRARVLLTVRQASLASHAGEVSFPGGTAEPDDADPVATALREAAEEVALDPSQCGLRVTGGLEVFALTVSGFRIVPVVALAERRPHCRPAPDEVARIVEAPVEAFLPDAPVELEERVIRERLIRYGVYPVEGERVWGATARMLGQLGAALAAPPIAEAGVPPAGEWHVRPAVAQDTSAIAAFLEPLAPEIARELPAPEASLVATIGDRIVGLASWARWRRADVAANRSRGFEAVWLPEEDRVAELTLLAVLPGLRGRGIGHALLEGVAAAARGAGHRSLVAWTLADSDVHASSMAARGFFRGASFRDLAVDRGVRANGEDRLLLARDLLA
jgi:8-oxo-dGTP pyrophosphatase MutT (NUDIX family)/ribosomal protein S18 acetylase RimI-like enzyme